MIEAERIQIAQAQDVVVPITYSSRMEDNEIIVPTRLSLLAFDVACLEATQEGADLLVIAGEQSWKESHRTTGDTLVTAMPQGTPNPIVLRDPTTRLINTAFQTEALGEALDEDHRITLVGWGFHRDRFLDNLERNAPDLEVDERDFVIVDRVLDDIWETAKLWNGDREAMERAFMQRYGFEPGIGWPEVQERGIATFTAHEQRFIMRALHRLSKGGQLAKFASEKIVRKGRLDDLKTDGTAKYGYSS